MCNFLVSQLFKKKLNCKYVVEVQKKAKGYRKPIAFYKKQFNEAFLFIELQ
jgi:hypothetical protein